MWDELDTWNSDSVCSCTCVCDGKSKISKSQQDQRLIQFLMGLNDTYGQARGNVLMLNPLPSMHHAYSLLLQDEYQRKIYVNAQIFPDSSSFMVNNQGKPHHKSGNPNFRVPISINTTKISNPILIKNLFPILWNLVA